MYNSKSKDLDTIQRALSRHREVLKKFEDNPPVHPHEHASRNISERQYHELRNQYNSLIRND